MARVQLTDQERALARRVPDKSVYVGLVQFRGPRGRQYRPVRTDACVSEERARNAVTDIRQRRYRSGAYPCSATLLLLDQLGNVIAEEKI